MPYEIKMPKLKALYIRPFAIFNEFQPIYPFDLQLSLARWRVIHKITTIKAKLSWISKDWDDEVIIPTTDLSSKIKT